MKNLMLLLTLVAIYTSISLAGYTYVSNTYGPVPNLYNSETLLMRDQGGDNSIYLNDFSSATIEGTSTLGQGTGGLWFLSLGEESHLDMSGGQIYQLDFNGSGDASALLSGGRIDNIWNYQITWKYEDGIGNVPNPHITIDCLDWDHNTSTNLLTGHWNDNSAFSIQLHDVNGKPPAFNNIQFIPEPATLLLFGIGGLLLRNRTTHSKL